MLFRLHVIGMAEDLPSAHDQLTQQWESLLPDFLPPEWPAEKCLTHEIKNCRDRISDLESRLKREQVYLTCLCSWEKSLSVGNPLISTEYLPLTCEVQLPDICSSNSSHCVTVTDSGAPRTAQKPDIIRQSLYFWKKKALALDSASKSAPVGQSHHREDIGKCSK